MKMGTNFGAQGSFDERSMPAMAGIGSRKFKARVPIQCDFRPGNRAAGQHGEPAAVAGWPQTLRSEQAEVYGGGRQAKGGRNAQMAGRPRFEEIFPGTDMGVDLAAPAERKSHGACPGGPPAAHGTNTAIENWLLHHLRQLYEEVCSEPLPNELSEMIDRFRKRRQDTEAGCENVPPLTPTARQGS